MIITVTSDKGGVGKTTTAVHLAAYMNTLAPTVLIDGDPIRSALKWSRNGSGNGLPFKVITHAQMVTQARNFQHIVVDTEGEPSEDDLKDLAENCDLLVIPAVPEAAAVDGLIETLAKLQKMNFTRYRVLLTMVPPKPKTDGDRLRAKLIEEGIPVFQADIPRLTAFDKAYADGVAVYDVKDDRNAQRGWEAYAGAGKEIANG